MIVLLCAAVLSLLIATVMASRGLDGPRGFRSDRQIATDFLIAAFGYAVFASSTLSFSSLALEAALGLAAVFGYLLAAVGIFLSVAFGIRGLDTVLTLRQEMKRRRPGDED